MGVIGAIVKPVVTLLSLPFVILTLGLFLLVINAWMLMLAGWVAGKLDLGFEVDGFWTALLGAPRHHADHLASSTRCSRTD